MPEPTTNYAQTHCKQCKNCWIRTTSEGGEILICLIDQAPVSKNLTGCNQYNPRSGLA